jgi:hypothetical protein
MELHGTGLASAIAYAEGQRWLAPGRTREDWIYLTRLGQLVAKQKRDLNCARAIQPGAVVEATCGAIR